MLLSRKASLLTVMAAFVLAPLPAGAQGRDVKLVQFTEDVVVLEYVGNVNNCGPNPNSCQFGYFNHVPQLAAFNNTPEVAANANFTFYTEAANQRVTNNGTLRIVDRTGITTLYRATSPATFSDQESFRSGIPIQVSTMKQQLILDTTTGDFTIVNVNTVTETSAFDVEGQLYQLGKEGDRFRTLLRGKTNATPPPGWFMAGYAVAVGKD